MKDVLIQPNPKIWLNKKPTNQIMVVTVIKKDHKNRNRKRTPTHRDRRIISAKIITRMLMTGGKLEEKIEKNSEAI